MNNNWLLIGQSACPPADGMQAFWVGTEDKCQQSNRIALDTLISTPSIDTVVLASLGPFYISNQGEAAEHQGNYTPARFVLQSDQGLQNKSYILYAGLHHAISSLEAAGKKVILFQDIPEIPFMPAGCIGRPLAPKQSCVLSLERVINRQTDYINIISRLQTAHPKLQVFRSLEPLCAKKGCALIQNNHLLYRDSHHLSLAGSNWLSAHFLSWSTQEISKKA